MRRVLAVAVAGLLLVLAVGLALLARDVRNWDRALKAGDASFRPGRAVEDVPWQARTRLPGDPAAELLGVGDELAYREAIALYWRARRGAGVGFERTRAQGAAETALGRVASDDGRPELASRAANLLGILAYRDSIPRPQRDAVSPELAVGHFRNAILLDPGNAAAKTNLELLLRLLEARGMREGQGEAGTSTGETGQGGASVSGEGEGY
jgi:hypothetical protein